MNPWKSMVFASLVLGPVATVGASPAWSLAPSTGASSLFTRHYPVAWVGKEESDFDAQSSILEAEISVRGPYALGARFCTDVESTDAYPGDRMVRRAGTASAYLKRILFEKGLFDVSTFAGLGYQWMLTEYVETNSPLDPPHPNRPPDESYSSPAAVLGLSQRVFYYVAGVTLNESVQVSAHAYSFHLDLGIPLGWRKR